MRARVPYALIGDVGFYQRAEIKDALALLRLAATPHDAQADEAFRRVNNVPARGFGAKAMEIVEAEATWRRVPLPVALETAPLPPRTRSAGLAFVDAIRGVGRDREATLADQLSLLLDATGYRAMLRDSRAGTTPGRLENLPELIGLAGSFHTARELLDHASLFTGGPDDDKTDRVRLMTLRKAKGLEFPHMFLPAWEAGVFPPDCGDPAEERRLAMSPSRAACHASPSHTATFAVGRGPRHPSLTTFPHSTARSVGLTGPPHARRKPGYRSTRPTPRNCCSASGHAPATRGTHPEHQISETHDDISRRQSSCDMGPDLSQPSHGWQASRRPLSGAPAGAQPCPGRRHTPAGKDHMS